ncbi:MAG TPA: hypothetical protein VFZ73_13655, partial [Gemmatimonadaceae bacterium]
QPPAPPVAPPTPAPSPVGSPPPFPVVSNASAIYVGPENLYDRLIFYHGGSLPTRFVLFSDSTFHLQTASFRFGVFAYTGRYSRSDSTFHFTWMNEGGPPWNALGTVRGDTLDIRYNENMVMSDFIDGAYVRMR